MSPFVYILYMYIVLYMNIFTKVTINIRLLTANVSDWLRQCEILVYHVYSKSPIIKIYSVQCINAIK